MDISALASMNNSGEASSATDRAQVPWKGAPERVRAASCPDPIAPRGTVYVSGCLGMQPQSGGKFRPRLNVGERPIANKYREVGRGGCFVEPSHGIESSKWAIFGKHNWRCGMNWKPGYGAQLRANLEPTKGVGRLRQQDGGHGIPKMDGAVARDLYPAVGARARTSMSRRVRRSLQNLGCVPGRSGRWCRSWW
ncbi:unnamed protein product [Brassica rapa subsp. narinosa]